MSYAAVIVICVCGYILGAGLLVRVFPFRSDKKKMELLKERFPYPVAIIAHRGGCFMGPENTIFTFRRAIIEGKADMLELDVQRSKDDEIVVSHDEGLSRTCGKLNKETNLGDIVVGEDPNLTLPQSLRTIQIHFKSAQKGEYYRATDDVPVDETTRVCLLSEVFDAFPDVPLHVDIKSEGADFTRRVLRLVEQYGRETKTLIGSSNTRNHSHIYDYFMSKYSANNESLEEKRKRFRIFAGPLDYAVVHLAFFLGVLPLIPLRFDVFSIPLFTKFRRKALGSWFLRLISYFLNSPTLWDHLQRRGILVVGWVLNDEDEFEEASQWPLNGIMTDDPIALNAFFQSTEPLTTMNLLH